MIINPKTAIEQGWITGIKDPEKQVQPNAIDFTADRAFYLDYNDFFISEDGKFMRGSYPAATVKVGTRWCAGVSVPREFSDRDGWLLSTSGSRSSLDILSDMYVTLPEGVAAQLIIRSSLARNGLVLQCGLYDAGFEGHIGCIIHNLHSWPAFIEPGTRVGQIMFVEAGTSTLYDGQYKHEEGTALEYQDSGDS
jgi:deoxycytidine triphosphate deaminase